MKKPFEEYTLQYDNWFDGKGKEIYLKELWALCGFMPKGRGVEVGIGTGRFAEILNLSFGVDPFDYPRQSNELKNDFWV